MRKENGYIIDFSGLAIGKHSFDFKVDSSLFERFEYEDILGSEVDVEVVLDKQERLMSFNMSFSGKITVACDRCLDTMDLAIKGERILLVRFGEEFMEEDDDLIVLPHSQYKLDLSQYLYEFIVLQKPMQCFHNEGECNEDMMDILSESNLQDEEIEKEIDPRWSKLKDIKFD